MPTWPVSVARSVTVDDQFVSSGPGGETYTLKERLKGKQKINEPELPGKCIISLSQ